MTTKVNESFETAKKSIDFLQKFISEHTKPVLDRFTSEQLMQELADRQLLLSNKEQEFLIDYAKRNCDFSELFATMSNFELVDELYHRSSGVNLIDEETKKRLGRLLDNCNYTHYIELTVNRLEFSFFLQVHDNKPFEFTRPDGYADMINFRISKYEIISTNQVKVTLSFKSLHTLIWLGKHIELK